MLHYKHKQHRHRRSQKFFHRLAKSTFCLPISGCWRYNANGRSHNTLPFLHRKENDPASYGNSSKNALRWQQSFFFTSYKSTWLTAISSHCLAALRATDVFKSHKQLNAYYRTWNWTFVAMLLIRNEGQFQNYPHPNFATSLCKQCSGHEWTATSKLHDTTTVNPVLAQCECHIGK